jgi:hypothetical protein
MRLLIKSKYRGLSSGFMVRVFTVTTRDALTEPVKRLKPLPFPVRIHFHMVLATDQYP